MIFMDFFLIGKKKLVTGGNNLRIHHFRFWATQTDIRPIDRLYRHYTNLVLIDSLALGQVSFCLLHCGLDATGKWDVPNHQINTSLPLPKNKAPELFRLIGYYRLIPSKTAKTLMTSQTPRAEDSPSPNPTLLTSQEADRANTATIPKPIKVPEIAANEGG